jgi:TPR repeat protein
LAWVILILGCSASPTVSPDSAKTVESTAAASAKKPAAPSATQSVAASTKKPAAVLASEHRVALVIGNGSYSFSPLLNPVNDARAISEALQSMGFQVTRLENATIKQMSDAARDFGDALQKGDVGLFFYAGHGMQIKGRNYLIPIGADIQREDEVPFNAFDAGLLLEKMETAHSRVNIVILDACRNNPFARSFRSSSQGLAQMDAPVGSYLSFATAPAKVASDGKDGNGLYTQHLLKAMRMRGLKIEEVFKRVRVNVMADSDGQQIPWDNSSLTGDFYFIPPGSAATTLATADGESHSAELDKAPHAPTADSKVLLVNVSPSSRPAPPSKVSPSPRPAPQPKVSPGSRPAAQSTVSPRAPSATQPTVDSKTNEAVAALYRKGIEAKGSGNVVAAAEAFGQAADAGHAEAAYEMGLLLKIGRKPIAQDLPRSQRLFLQAAEQGNIPAQYQVAQMFAQGVGVAPNCTQAIGWAHKAAEAGLPAAALLLGELNMADCEGSKNPQEAARWFRVAADKGLANAQFSLGVLYMTGEGVPKDLNQARKWLTAAASKGNTSARFYLGRLDN